MTTKEQLSAKDNSHLYCERCGALPNGSTWCRGFPSHHFVMSGPKGAFCEQCGTLPGGHWNCRGFVSHQFINR
jgi:hypothetical protein